MRQQEFADRRIEREAVSPLPCCVHEHRARAVDDVTSRNLAATGLEHVLHLPAYAARDLPNDREDRSDGHVDIDVGRSIQWIEEQTIFPTAEVLGNVDDAR